MLKNNQYVNGPTLYREICEWYKSGKEEIPEIIYRAVIQICERLSTKRRFVGYTYRDEMVSSAIEKCIVALVYKKFNPEKSKNPFAYFTKIAVNEFYRVLNEEAKESYVKHKSLFNHLHESSLNGQIIELPNDDGSGRIEKLMDRFEKGNTKDE